jgi:hypothetical protein
MGVALLDALAPSDNRLACCSRPLFNESMSARSKPEPAAYGANEFLHPCVASGVLTTAATATTIAAYAGVRTHHHASEPGSSAAPALQTSVAGTIASIATPAIPAQYKGWW